MKGINIPLILTLILMNGCTQTEKLDSSSEKEQIKKNFRNWLKGVESGNVDDYFNFITDDFIFLGPGMKPINNRDSLRTFLGTFLSENNFSMPEWTTDEVIIRDNLSIHRYSGMAYIRPKNDTTIVKSDRKYLDVLRRNDKGEWKVYLHSFNTNR